MNPLNVSDLVTGGGTGNPGQPAILQGPECPGVSCHWHCGKHPATQRHLERNLKTQFQEKLLNLLIFLTFI